jgi:hypothetical protein
MANDNALQVLTDVERRLAAVTTVDGAKAIRDQAEAFRVYAKSARKGLDVQNRAATIKLLAERRAGELLALIQRGRGSKVRATLARTYKENEIAARTVGRRSQRFQKLRSNGAKLNATMPALS